MSTHPDIPPSGANCTRNGSIRNGVYGKLRSLEIGEYFEWPIEKRPHVYRYAKDVGIRIVTRQFGSDTVVRVYRSA